MSDRSGSNGELLGRLREGDEGALAALFSEHRDHLKRIVLIRMDRRLRGRADASDVLQEAYIDARQRLRQRMVAQGLSAQDVLATLET